MNSEQEFLTSELRWSQAAASRVSGPLADVIRMSTESGLEGVAFPVLVVPGQPNPLLASPITPSDVRWAEFLSELGAFNRESTSAILRWLAEHNIPVTLQTSLLGVTAISIAEESLHQLLSNDEFSVRIAELDAPGQLELNVSRITVHANAEQILDLGLDGRNQRVAVLDGEINGLHPGLSGRVLQKSNFSDSSWGTPPTDAGEDFCQRHSTQVAGIIAGNGGSREGPTAFRGVAPGAEIWNYKIAPSSSRGSKVIQAMETAHFDGVRIINLSWGARGVTADGTSAWTQTAEVLFGQGTLVIKSAGNQGPNANSVSVPADGNHVLSVGATTRDGSTVYDGSSRGPTTDGRVKPDLVAPGGGTTAPSADFYEATIPPGTSFAAPFVAGAAALLWQARPDATAQMIRDALSSSCHPIPEVSTNVCGNGLLDIEAALQRLETS